MALRKELSNIVRLALGSNSQDWLSEQSGVSQSTISRLLRGVGTPSPQNLKDIAKALGLNPNELLRAAGIADDTIDEEPIDASALYMARRLSKINVLKEEAMEAVSAVVDSFVQAAEKSGGRTPIELLDLALKADAEYSALPTKKEQMAYLRGLVVGDREVFNTLDQLKRGKRRNTDGGDQDEDDPAVGH